MGHLSAVKVCLATWCASVAQIQWACVCAGGPLRTGAQTLWSEIRALPSINEEPSLRWLTHAKASANLGTCSIVSFMSRWENKGTFPSFTTVERAVRAASMAWRLSLVRFLSAGSRSLTFFIYIDSGAAASEVSKLHRRAHHFSWSVSS